MGAHLSPSVSPVTVSFSLATAPMSPARSSGTGVCVLPCITPMCASFSVRAAIEVGEHGIVLHHPRHHFEVAHAAGEGIGHGLENVSGDRLVVGNLALHGLSRPRGRGPAPCRAPAAKADNPRSKSSRPLDADIGKPGRHHHRVNAPLAQRPARGREPGLPPGWCPSRRTPPSTCRCLRPPSPPAPRGPCWPPPRSSAGISISLRLAGAVRRRKIRPSSRTRSMAPLKFFSSPSGSWMGITARPKAPRTASSVRSRLARSRSI